MMLLCPKAMTTLLFPKAMTTLHVISDCLVEAFSVFAVDRWVMGSSPTTRHDREGPKTGRNLQKQESRLNMSS